MTRANDIQHGGSHYKHAKFQHWDLIAKSRIGYLEGCASKYPTRWRRKNGVEDLNKSIHFIDKIVECYHDYDYRPTGFASEEDLNLFFEDNQIVNVHEIRSITLLCTWRSLADLSQAKEHVKELLIQAEKLSIG